VVLLAGLVASLGWIMVASGLINRPWVNAYKLTLHLSAAFITYGFLLWTTFRVIGFDKSSVKNNHLKKWNIGLLILVGLQIVLGGIMSGMKAGLAFPTWPLIDGGIVPSVLFDSSNWTIYNFENYDKNPFMPALIQVLHRSCAYVLTILGFWYFFKMITKGLGELYNRALYFWFGTLLLQVLLGILTLINCVGIIPVGLGVLHQGGALILLSATLFLNFLTGKEDY
jgi:cytochrome c oxidase assembly protein subunit 15